MTREAFAAAIHWGFIIWVMGIINVGGMVPQLVKLVTTRTTKGLETKMFWIYLMTQIAFAAQGYFRHDNTLMWCFGLAAGVNAAVITLIYRFRKSEKFLERLQEVL